jgi:hypothetical protein
MATSQIQLSESMESLVISHNSGYEESQDTHEQTTPCKTPAQQLSSIQKSRFASENSPSCANSLSTPNSTSKQKSASGRRTSTVYTNLNSLHGLPPIRASPSSVNSEEKQLSPHQQIVENERPAWNESFAKPNLTPKRVPWSNDIRLRFRRVSCFN